MTQAPPVRPGDAVFFWGDDFLSDGIRVVTGGLKGDAPSHVTTVYDSALPLPNGLPQTEWFLIESTILDGHNGVQLNAMNARTQAYKGAIAIAYLSDKVRAFIDWDAVWKFADPKIGTVRYNVAEIAAYLANLVLPAPLDLDKSDPHAAVCSEFRAELLRAGGWPGLDPFRTPPETLFRMRMYRELFVVQGNPPIDTFNSW